MFVEWQNELLASDETKPGREFWRDLCRTIDFAALKLVALPLEKHDGDFSPEFITVLAQKLAVQLEQHWFCMRHSLAHRAKHC